MRAFIILCLVAVACADQLGYNYQPVANAEAGLSFAPGAATNAAPSYAAPAEAATSFAAPAAGPVYASPEPAQTAAAPAYAAPAPLLEKEYYSFSANEGDFHEPAASDQIASNLKKGLRVVFIKGPEHNGIEDAALALAKEAAEQQTTIYVLNKQADIGELANKLNSANSHKSSKPEVHFVKYRTAQDAVNAQQAIQGQYDSLGGSTQAHNDGVASTLNFASQAPAQVPAAPQAPENAYLPASVYRQRT